MAFRTSGERLVHEETSPSASAQPIVVAMAAVVTASALAVALVTVGVKHGKSADFSRPIEYVTWSTLTIGLVVVSAVGGVYCLPGWLNLHRRSSRAARLISYCVAVLVTLCYDASPQVGVRLFLERGSSDLDHSLYREIALGVLIGLFTLPTLSGLVLAALLLSRPQPPWGDTTSNLVAITDLLWIRGQLQRFLAVLAMVIAGNILVAAAFRRLLLVYRNQPPIDSSILVVYGAMMTGLLALLFVPAYIAWLSKARMLRDELCPWPSDGIPGHEWYVSRVDLEDLLNLKVSASAAFTTGLGLLAPFASSLITVAGISPPK